MDVIAGMNGDRDNPRLGGMLQLAMITARAHNNPSVSAELFENVANLHVRISTRGCTERKARGGPLDALAGPNLLETQKLMRNSIRTGLGGLSAIGA